MLSFKKMYMSIFDVTVATSVVVVNECVEDVDDVHVAMAFIAVLLIVEGSSLFKLWVVGSIVGILSL